MFSSTFDKEKRLWHGCDVPPLYNPKISIAQALFNAMTIFGSKVAQISDNNGVQLTYDEIRLQTIRAAQHLQGRGFKPKQTFVLFARNNHQVAPIVFASLAIGCPLNCIDASFVKSALIHMLNTTKPVVVFCEITCYELLNECLTELGNDAHIFTFGGCQGRSEPIDNLFQVTNTEHQFVPVNVDGENDTAMIVCSSGTTGLSKGVCLSHASLLDTVVHFNPNFNCNHVMLCFSSLYWISGVWVLMRGTLSGATRIITSDIFSPEVQLRLIEQYNVTFAFNAPHQVGLILKNERFTKTNLSSLMYQMIGGSKVPFHLKADLNRHLPNGSVIVVFGLSETGGFLTMDFPPTKEKDTIGRLITGCLAKVIDNDGNRCEPNQDGELCFKMPYQFLGYFDNQKATDDIFDEEGFIKTGDVGRFDENGDLYHTGRKKELLKYYGLQISPSEIDAYLIESPHIKAACVVGIPDAMGDMPAAAIVRTDASNISEHEICQLVADHFADHCKLRGGVFFVDALPTTPSGKVLRNHVTQKIIALINEQKT